MNTPSVPCVSTRWLPGDAGRKTHAGRRRRGPQARTETSTGSGRLLALRGRGRTVCTTQNPRLTRGTRGAGRCSLAPSVTFVINPERHGTLRPWSTRVQTTRSLTPQPPRAGLTHVPLTPPPKLLDINGCPMATVWFRTGPVKLLLSGDHTPHKPHLHTVCFPGDRGGAGSL